DTVNGALQHPRRCEVRGQLQRAVEQAAAPHQSIGKRSAGALSPCLEKELIGLEGFGADVAQRSLDACRHTQLACDAFDDLVPNAHDALLRSVVFVRPNAETRRIAELSEHAQALSILQDAPFEDILETEVGCNVADASSGIPVCEGCRATGDLETVQALQRDDQLLGQTFGETAAIRVA